MSLLIGAKELGLKVEWRYAFLGQDDTASTTPGVVFLEIGGKIAPGVFDHHHGAAGDTCAAEVVFRNRELAYGHLLSPWLARREEGRLLPGTVFQPTIVTHRDPDWDSVVAAFLVQRLIEDGDFPPEAAALVQYTRLVDQGKVQLFGGRGSDDWGAEILSQRPEILAPHAGYLAIQNLEYREGDRDEKKLRLGLKLVERVLERLRSAHSGRLKSTDFIPVSTTEGRKHPATLWSDDPEFAAATQLLREDAWRYDEDRAQRDESIKEVLLPAEDGGDPIAVPSFVLKGPAKSKLNKYWVRSDGFPFFICPYSREPVADTATETTVFGRVILSLDPNWSKDGRKPTLRGLGFVLEREESRERRKGGGADERGLPPRFPAPYCDNADPWYDGRGHDYTIVDAPMASTVLPYSRIVEIATGGGFWQLPLEMGVAVAVRVLREAGPPARSEGFGPLGFPGAAATLESYRSDAFEVPLERSANESAVRMSKHVRSVDGGEAFPLELTRFESAPGTSFENLLRHLGQAPESREPDYLLVQVRPDKHFLGMHFLAPGRLRRLFQGLDCSPPEDLALLANQDVLLCSGQILVLPNSTDKLRGADVENFLYAVFIAESLSGFSRRIAGHVPEQQAATRGAGRLRESFIRFQTRHYQIDVSRLSRGRQVFRWLSDGMQLQAHYAEVQSELDRLTELEQEEAEEHRKRFESFLGVILFFVAGFGVLQTWIALDTWQVPFWTKPLAAALVVAIAAGLHHRARRSVESERAR